MSLSNGSTNGELKEKPAEEVTDNNLENLRKEEEKNEGFQILETEAFEKLPEDAPLQEVLAYFSSNTYNAASKDLLVQTAMNRCIELLKRDYDISIIDNTNGVLCQHYPYQIVFFDGEKGSKSAIYEENVVVPENFEILIQKAHRARCRERFPVPVIFYKGKLICRSATLSLYLEVIARTVKDYLRPLVDPQNERHANEIDELLDKQETSKHNAPRSIMDDLQTADIALMEQLRIGTVFDLMVENKKHKVGLAFSSSEKVDKDDPGNRYANKFQLVSLPYPGCEFFEELFKHNYVPEGLRFDWSQAMCDAPLDVPKQPSLDHLHINWSEYKEWDLVQITQNYIRYILKYIQESEKGVLIHCISGWDRTPLFICLIRLSLWADGLVHESLTVHEILYFTIAYDWMLFGHQLKTRLYYNEEILLFCFNFLKYLVSEEFSILPPRSRSRRSDKSTESQSNASERTIDDFFSDSKTSLPSVKIDEVSTPSKSSDESLYEDAIECKNKKRKHSPCLQEGEDTKTEPVMAAIHEDEESNDSMDNAVGPLLYRHSPKETRTSSSASSQTSSVAETQPVAPSRPRHEPIIELEPTMRVDITPMECQTIAPGLLLRTDPIEIPSSGSSSKSQTGEAGSAGSWLHVSSTGSLRFYSEFPPDMENRGQDSGASSRKERLTAVRSLFYKSYYNSVSNVNYGTNKSVLTNLLNSLKGVAADVAAGIAERLEEPSNTAE